MEHLNVGQTAVLLDDEGQHHLARNTVLLSDGRITDLALNPVAEIVERTALERRHRLGDQERLLLDDLLLLDSYLLYDLHVVLELGEIDVCRNFGIVGYDFQNIGNHGDLRLLGRLGRLLLLTRDLHDLLLDGGDIQIELFYFLLLGRPCERSDNAAECNYQTNLEQKTPLVLEVGFR